MNISLLFALLAGVSISVAWWLPGTIASALLGWACAFSIVAFSRSNRFPYLGAFLIGAVLNCLGFYWLFWTIKDFGGFTTIPALLVFLFYVVASTNQQLLYIFIYRHLPERFRSLGIACACAWVASEFLSIRIFPWSLGHTQAAFSLFIQSVDLIGTPILTFVMLWVSESAWNALKQNRLRPALASLVAVVVLSIYGQLRIFHFMDIPDVDFEVSLVQANISTAEKHNVRFFLRNKERYDLLSRDVPKDTSLVIWPESVVTDFIHDEVRSVTQDPRIPFLDNGAALLAGGLTFRSESEIFNAAIAVTAKGEVYPPYHKRILMPFGEFTPFSKTFPWLKDLNATAGEFTAGTSTMVYSIPRKGDPSEILKVAPLICYEDIVPSMGREAVQAGAEVLVNMTNDAWFGDTVAPHQHHLIALFRAVENRRYLLRSTNSGLTAVVDPRGRTLAQLPTFSDGVLNTHVRRVQDLTLFTSLFGEYVWWLLSISTLLIAAIRAFFRGRKESISPAGKKG